MRSLKEKALEKKKKLNMNTKDIKKKKKNKTSTKLFRKDQATDQSITKSQGVAVNSKRQRESIGAETRKKKKSKKNNREHVKANEDKSMPKKREDAVEEVYCISSGDEDLSRGMNKWLTDYHQSRPDLKALQQRIDEFMVQHDEKLEQERKDREARIAEEGWTVVKHHKGRKKTADTEGGITVGSVAQAAVEDQMARKKRKEVGLNFYRFQRKEAQRNEIMMLQSKFEQDKKRIQQLRAARKFRPY
ncbi:hypothetical protein K2173_025969 [Erythroxylum novogranatense]|uniref:Ribosomal RNA-processing protein 7 C-terminal domain-containing protein n=1 Tax=Erythroxylum novogranatense TaxID=1862640 RepID=A0AAV8SHZ1_9ROSI|nr:hypothetical protein K2173_025969 [Erythroxylum novogranatense]